MDKMSKDGKKFVEILSENKIQLLITLISVVIAIINFLIVNKLQPIAKDLQFTIKRVDAIETQYIKNSDLIPINSRLDRIDQKLENLIGIFLKP